MAGRSLSGSSTALISPTIGKRSASSSPGRGGLCLSSLGPGTIAHFTMPPAIARDRPVAAVYTRCAMSPPLKLPLEIEDIKAILPHRHPFLLVDRILEFEEDKRILGVKNVSSDERYFIAGPGGVPVLP